MKRRFLNALLFGALLVAAPAGTFVSCSDYDDDISSLQGQITTNATDLQSLVDEKLSNVNAEIESLKAANSALEDAIDKAKTDAEAASLAAAQTLVNNAKSELEAALAAAKEELAKEQSSQAEKIQALLLADADLSEGIIAARERADKALALAETVEQTANNNKEELGKLSESLTRIQESLQDQIDVLSDNYKDLLKRVEEAEADLEAQQAAITKQGEKVDGFDQKIQDAKDELNAEIAKALGLSEDIDLLDTKLDELAEKLGTTKEELQGKIDQAVADLTQKYDQEIQKLNQSISGKASAEELTALNNAIQTQLATTYYTQAQVDELIKQATKDMATDGTVSNLQTRLEQLEEAYNATGNEESVVNQLAALSKRLDGVDTKLQNLSTEINKLGTLVNVLFTNMQNLITGIIYQGSEIKFRYAKITTSNHSGTAWNAAYDATAKAVYFPSKDNKLVTMPIDKYCVERDGGKVYATINPAEIEFNLKGGTIVMKNSQNKANAQFELGEVTPSEHLLTRATSSANGFYEMPIYATYQKDENDKEKVSDIHDAAPETDNALYALTTTYEQTIPVKQPRDGESTMPETETVTKTVTSEYKLTVDAQEATTVRSFCVVGESDNATQKGPGMNTTTGCNIRFSGLKGTIALGAGTTGDDLLEAGSIYKSYINVIKGKEYLKNWKDDEVLSGDSITKVLEVTDAGKNQPIELYWYVLNYDGFVDRYKTTVIFTKPLFDAETITVSHTPEQNATQTIDVTKDFFARNFLNTANKAKWLEETASSSETLGEGLVSGDIFIAYYDADNNPVTNLAQANSITKVELSYNPANLKVGQENKLTITYKDANGNEINDLIFVVDMKQPHHLDIWTGTSLSRRISAAFGSIGSDNNLTAAWASLSGGKASYALKGSFTDLDNAAVRDAEKADEATGWQYSYGSRYAFASTVNDESNTYGISIDNDNYVIEANTNTIHTYGTVTNPQAGKDITMTQSINYYDLTNLPAVIDNSIKLRFLSLINYSVAHVNAPTNLNFNTPITGASINVNNTFTLRDYTKSNATAKLDWMDDEKITNVDVELVKDADNNWDLIKNLKVTKGTSAYSITFDVTSEAVKQNVEIGMRLKVTDEFGIETIAPFKIKLNASEINAQSKRK